MASVRIVGTGSYVPPKVLTNFDLEEMGLDTSDEWIVKRTGVSERRMAAPDVTVSDLALEASRRAISAAGIKVKDVDLIILATITPDTCCPSAANWLEAKLGAHGAVSFDITAACSGFIFALDVARQYLMNGARKCVLIAGGEVMTRTLNWKDRATCILWGDGSGAAVVTLADSGPEVLSTHIRTDGENGQDLLLPGGGSRTTPICHESVDKDLHLLNMIEASSSFKVAVRGFIDSIVEGADYTGIAIDDIRWFIPHQANLRMFRSISKHLNIPMEKFYVTLNKYGNISGASCAIALDEAVRDGSVQKDDLVCMPVFGGGLTRGCAMIKW